MITIEDNRITQVQCPQCLRWLSLSNEYFHADKASSSGLKIICKDCTKENSRIKTQKCSGYQTENIHCDRELPLTSEYFYYYDKKKKKLRHNCKDCTSKYQAILNARKRDIKNQRKECKKSINKAQEILFPQDNIIETIKEMSIKLNECYDILKQFIS